MAIYNAQRSALRKQETSTWRWHDTELVQTFNIKCPMSFCSSAILLRDNGREEEALSTLAEARGLYPREQSLIIEELNIYLDQRGI